MNDLEKQLLEMREECLRRFDQKSHCPVKGIPEPLLTTAIDMFLPVSREWKLLPTPAFIDSILKEHYNLNAFGYVDDTFESRGQYEELFNRLIKYARLKTFL